MCVKDELVQMLKGDGLCLCMVMKVYGSAPWSKEPFFFFVKNREDEWCSLLTKMSETKKMTQ